MSATTVLQLVCGGASLLVSGMLIHYFVRAGARRDSLCIFGMVAASFGLLASGHAAHGGADTFLVGGYALTLTLCGFIIWREGLKRIRN